MYLAGIMFCHCQAVSSLVVGLGLLGVMERILWAG